MKKTLLVSLAAVYLLCTTMTGFAAVANTPAITVKDPANDVINVSGKVDTPEFVTLLVLNPEKSEENIDFSNSADLFETVQYVGTCWADGSEYNFDVPMYGTSGGLFTIIITAGDEKFVDEPTSIEYYFSNEKKQVIANINDVSGTDEIETLLLGGVDDNEDRFNGAFTLYSMSDDILFTNGDISKVAEVVFEMLKSTQAFAEDDVNAFSQMLKMSGILGAYNAKNAELLLTDDYLNYTAELELEGTSQYDDYLNKLSEDGRDNLHNDLIKGKNKYYTAEKVREKFTELIAYYGIVGHNESGYGHIDYYFDTYKEVYEDAGFKLDDLKANKKNSVYKALMKEKTSDLDDLKDAFNDLVDENSKKNKGGSSGGSGGSGGGSGFTPPPVTATSDTNYLKPKSSFIDISTVEWAHEAILGLADRGIVNGVGNGCFAPNNNVSRAQFMKMLTAAIGITVNNADVPFKDVPNNYWGKNYIAAAVANGIANGINNNEFAPEGYVTREQAAAFVARAIEKKGGVLISDASAFDDEDKISTWAKDAVNGLKNAGIVSGSGNNMFAPKNSLTRAEAASMIYSLMNYLGLTNTAE